MRESFFSHPVKNYLSKRLEESEHILELLMTMEIEDAWQSAPEVMAEKFRAQFESDDQLIRGLIWELFVWRNLQLQGHQVTYEESIPGSVKKLDFKIKSASGYEFYIEAKSIGPNEESLISENTDQKEDFDLELRKILSSHLRQIEDYNATPVLLAFSNSFTKLIETPFEKVRSLYGQPGIRIDLNTGESQATILDEGFWFRNSLDGRSFDGIIFHNGLVPGFSSFQAPSLWLNPNPIFKFDYKELLWPMDIYRSEEMLYKTSKQENYIWKEVRIF